MNIPCHTTLAITSGLADFFQALSKYEFLQNAVWAGLLVSVAGGVVGTYVVVRRIIFMAGSIAHCVLGGIGAALYLRRAHGWEWLDPIYGAVAVALLAAVIIGWVSMKAKQREDTVIGAMWAIGMAAGILFISQTPGYAEDLISYLFGSILMVTKADLWIIAVLDAVVVLLGLLFYKQFLAVCFDEEFARTRGIRVEFYYMLLLILTALTVVLLVRVVGVILVIALLPLPVAVAGQFARRLWQMMILAALLTVLFTSSGLALSYGPGLRAGPTIIMLSGAVYLLVIIASSLRRRFSKIKP